MTPAQRRSIALDYWFFILIAVGILIMGAFVEPAGVQPITIFCATALIIHAHGNRIHATLLALHTEEED